jgi:hypothetical protein
MGFGSDIGFIVHFSTQLVTTINFSAITNFHTLQITRTLKVFSDFTSRTLEADL